MIKLYIYNIISLYMDHLVYIHYGITPEYLYDTMEIAKSYNKNLDVTLITNDKSCIDRLNDLDIKYEYIDFFNTEGYNSFKEIFIYRCEWDIEEKIMLFIVIVI